MHSGASQKFPWGVCLGPLFEVGGFPAPCTVLTDTAGPEAAWPDGAHLRVKPRRPGGRAGGGEAQHRPERGPLGARGPGGEAGLRYSPAGDSEPAASLSSPVKWQ